MPAILKCPVQIHALWSSKKIEIRTAVCASLGERQPTNQLEAAVMANHVCITNTRKLVMT